MGYKKKYRKIIDELIRKSFPSLKNERFLMFEINTKNIYAFVWYIWFFTLFGISKKARKLQTKALKGMFVHELSHLESIIKIGFLEKVLYFLNWLFSKKVRADFERKTDLLLIKKGYGKDYFILLEEATKGWSKKRWKKRTKKGYLSPKQVKSYMKKLR